jgi:hypothetical protein
MINIIINILINIIINILINNNINIILKNNINIIINNNIDIKINIITKFILINVIFKYKKYSAIPSSNFIKGCNVCSTFGRSDQLDIYNVVFDKSIMFPDIFYF